MDAIGFGKQQSILQAKLLDPAWIPQHSVAPGLQRHALPSDAVLELTRLAAAAPSAGDLAEILALDALPSAERGALTTVIDAYLNFNAVTVTAPPSPEGLAAITGARAPLLDAVAELVRALPAPGPVSTIASCSPTVVAPAIAIDLTTCADTYAQNVALSIDAGGNDVYRTNAGGSKILVGSVTNLPLVSAYYRIGAGALIDLGGNDAYGQASSASCYGANGGAEGNYLNSNYEYEKFPAAGFLLDAGGTDSYTAGTVGTNGGGADYGVGFLLDAGSTADTYVAGGTAAALCTDTDWYTEQAGTNGGGADSGVGTLIDMSGSNLFQAGYFDTTQPCPFLWQTPPCPVITGGDYGTNGGGTEGIGFLYAANGGNTFQAGDAGTNGGSFSYRLANGYLGYARGVGTLVTRGTGNDKYYAAAPGGVNFYQIYFYGTNGGSADGGVGFLYDESGVEAYAGTNGIGDGGLGVGILYDGGGTGDTYYGEGCTYPSGGYGYCNDKNYLPPDYGYGSLGAQIDHVPS